VVAQLHTLVRITTYTTMRNENAVSISPENILPQQRKKTVSQHIRANEPHFSFSFSSSQKCSFHFTSSMRKQSQNPKKKAAQTITISISCQNAQSVNSSFAFVLALARRFRKKSPVHAKCPKKPHQNSAVAPLLRTHNITLKDIYKSWLHAEHRPLSFVFFWLNNFDARMFPVTPLNKN